VRWSISGMATIICRSGYTCADLSVPFGRSQMPSDSFRELHSWLEGRDVQVVKADRRDPLVVLRPSLAAEIGKLRAV
jgi:hypothetical protein